MVKPLFVLVVMMLVGPAKGMRVVKTVGPAKLKAMEAVV
jgi:hypothetical protein